MTLEQCIVQAARGWIGTRFSHQGRVKKTQSHTGGVDCLGLLIGVAEELELQCLSGRNLCSYDEQNYPHYPDTQRLRNILSGALLEIPVAGIKPADIVLLDIDGFPQHMGVIAQLKDSPSLIHAYAPARSVVEHHLDKWWAERIVSAHRITHQ